MGTDDDEKNLETWSELGVALAWRLDHVALGSAMAEKWKRGPVEARPGAETSLTLCRVGSDCVPDETSWAATRQNAGSGCEGVCWTAGIGEQAVEADCGLNGGHRRPLVPSASSKRDRAAHGQNQAGGPLDSLWTLVDGHAVVNKEHVVGAWSGRGCGSESRDDGEVDVVVEEEVVVVVGQAEIARQGDDDFWRGEARDLWLSRWTD
jgi:hypothetical protein